MPDAGNQIHHLFCRTSGFVAYATSVPKLGVLSGNPNPKKVRPDSIPIFPAKFKVNATIISELTFGNK